jgi:hypothetical protein
MKKYSARKTSKPARLSPEQRAHICERIRHQLALEFLSGKSAGREFWCRVGIGLPPRPRPFHWEQHR